MGAKNSQPVGAGNTAKDRVVLQESFDPTCYEVTISTNIRGNYRFDGSAIIHSTIIPERGISKITLHARDLFLETVKYVPENGNPIKAKEIMYNVEATTVTMTFETQLPKGKGGLHLTFIGTHNDQMAGFYRSGYMDRSGEKAVMVSTQFEALDARRCFPCIDEPGRKATFKASLIVDDGLTALGNMPIVSNTLLDDGKRRKVVFEETCKMSTYLLAFVVGDLDYVEKKTKNGVPIKVYTPPGKKELGTFALDVGAKVLDLFDDFFQIPYPLPKYDMVAIPEFAMGAMENYGLVTYREVDLLIDPKTASSQQKQRVATVVAHETGHQWFGNLVTMQWWDGLWLNEGFASWIQSYAMNAIFPEWTIWEQFIIQEQASAMRLDALVSSHPIQVPIKHAEEIEQVFDAISYHKGSSVVRLIFSYLGESAFQKGLQIYMKRHQFQNTETTDLWKAWEEASGKPVAKVMASWTDQMGFPCVTVKSAKWAPDNSSCTLELEQEWFIADGSKHPDSKHKLWSIPLLVNTGHTAKPVNLGIMDSRRAIVKVPIPSKTRTWIKLNGDQHVPMRVNYTAVQDEFGDKFKEAILKMDMSTEDRAGMLLDSYALTKAGLVDPANLLELLSAYENEITMPVFSAIEDVLSAVKKILQASPELHAQFIKFGARIIKKASERIGWDPKEDDGHLGTLLRAILIRLQSNFMLDDPEIKSKAMIRFEKFSEDPKENYDALPSDIKTAVIKIVLANSPDESNYNRCLEIIDLAETTQEKKEIYLAMGYANTLDLKRRSLDWCTSGALKKQDFFYVMGSVSGSGQDGLELSWSYLRENFTRIVDMIRTASPSLLAAVVTYSCGSFASEARAKEIEEFFKVNNEHPVPLISRKLDQIVENTRANAKFLDMILKSKSFKAFLASSSSA